MHERLARLEQQVRALEDIDAIKKVTLDDVNRVVKTRFPKELDWVVIGRASVCRPVVEKFGKVIECKVVEPGFGPSQSR